MSDVASEYLNNLQCRIGISEGKGRGVFATKVVPAGTIIEVSPVLLFSSEEYSEHGKYTILDNYTYNWPDGRMALALGLGSLFNHSESPNLSYMLDTSSSSIRYMTTRVIQIDEELCIFYGHKLWFEAVEPISASEIPLSTSVDSEDIVTPDEWEILAKLPIDDADSVLKNPFNEGDWKDLIEDVDLPIVPTSIVPEEEKDNGEEEFVTIPVWAVDLPDPRETGVLLKWATQNIRNNEDLDHLRRVRHAGATHTLLLTSSSSTPEIPAEFTLPEPYQTEVPAFPARSLKSLKVKCTMWPTIYAPRRKHEPEKWLREKAAWAWDAVRVLRVEALRAIEKGELPIISYIPAPIPNGVISDQHPAFTAHDLRQSTSHPLRHSALILIRQVAEWRASFSPSKSSIDSLANSPLGTSSPAKSTESAPSASLSSLSLDSSLYNTPRNGTHYLLTGLTVFMTHEPCIMCSMALLHSRVKEIIYVIPMDRTGGCGGSSGKGTCIPRLKGVNHRFAIARWRNLRDYYGADEVKLEIDGDFDA